METTYESRPAIQKYLTALEARLKATPGRADDGPVEAGLADAREFLLSEWQSLRDADDEPADDKLLYEHFVSKFGTPDEVAAGYGVATSMVLSPRADALPKGPPPTPEKPDRGCLRNALALVGMAIVAACGAAVYLFNRAADEPQTVPAVEPAARPPLGELRTSWAERVVSFRFGADDSRDPEEAAPALGAADCSRPDAEPPTCLTLGDGGELVVEFVTHSIVDGIGPDLAIHEVGYFEPVRVAVSENGEDWFELGVSDQRLSTFDLATAGVTTARFVRVTDALSMRHVKSSPPGAEIDSVTALNSVATAAK